MSDKNLIRITALVALGIRRAGVHHPATAVEHSLEAFSDAQLEQLQADPNLKVELVSPAAPNDPKRAKPSAVSAAAGESAPAAATSTAAAAPAAATPAAAAAAPPASTVTPPPATPAPAAAKPADKPKPASKAKPAPKGRGK